MTTRLIRKICTSTSLLLVAIAAAGAATPSLAQAATTTKIVGTVTNGTTRISGASVGLYRWNSTTGTWVWLGNVTTSNSGGNYAITATSGYYYEVRAAYTQSECLLGGPYTYVFTGYSVVFLAKTASANAAVPIQYVQQYAC